MYHEYKGFKSNNIEEVQADGRLRKEVEVPWGNHLFTFYYHGTNEQELITDLHNIIDDHLKNNVKK